MEESLSQKVDYAACSMLPNVTGFLQYTSVLINS